MTDALYALMGYLLLILSVVALWVRFRHATRRRDGAYWSDDWPHNED